MGHIIVPVISGINPTGMFFGPGHLVVCGRHCRDLLQPVTSYDREKGYGLGDCPFCPGGMLHGRYHKCRSKKRWWAELEALARHQAQSTKSPTGDSSRRDHSSSQGPSGTR